MGSNRRLFRSLCLFFVLAVGQVYSFQSHLPCSRQRYVALHQSNNHDNLPDNIASTIQPTRRDALVQSASFALSSLLIGSSGTTSPAFAATTNPQTIVMTGANSGLGFEACKQLAAQGHNVVLACRSLAKATDAIQRIRQAGTESTNSNLMPAACDLASLESVKAFAQGLEGFKIDALCLNAGIARNAGATDIIRTVDGFELTGR